MAKLKFDTLGEKYYEAGIEKCVLYLKNSSNQYPKGVAWNGLVSVSENASGGEVEPYYMDDIKYLELRDTEEFEATIEAYTYPEEFELCDGSYLLDDGVYIRQQPRKEFGLCYKTLKGNDISGEDYGYKLHLIYNATASPSDRDYETINDDPEALLFSWDVSSVPIKVEGSKPTSQLILDSTKIGKKGMKFLEEALYGTADSDSYLPSPSEVLAIIAESKNDAILVDNVGNVIVTNDGYLIKIEESF